ncbi:cadherin-86C [Condylostylus longicornis]|uniref:cadherin-86C n=1 Tax=Condylostylus longicornis TaxID=2530218 RepID=UPI00244E5B52|nr:cadherin-86C [Condylostylus longicornis]XP_055377611.1 cadherin-86C [Condylostylus longicornis]
MASITGHLLRFYMLLIGMFSMTTYSVDPKFDPSTRMRLVLIPADAMVGSVIYRLRATDEEFDYPLAFELVGDASSSIVQVETLPCTKYNSVCQANVILQRRLEPGRFHDFQVSVKDTKGGMSVQSCSITATNFTTPYDLIFPHKPGIIIIPEDAKRGTELGYIITRKNPLSPRPVYLELWGSPLFAIRQKIASVDTTEGTIFLLGPLDFEKQAMFHLTLLANDPYAEPGQDSRNIAGLEVVVIVQDVQDQPPIFTMAPPVTKLPNGLLPGDKVLQVHAEDGDKGNPREIRYGLVSEGNPFTSFFDINDTSGEIFLMRPLDEVAAITHIGDPVLLTVVAEEVKVNRDEPPAMASTIQLAFFLPERSNSPPYFENDQYVTRIDENAPQGTTLQFSDPYVPRVYDNDNGKNGVFSLTLLNNNGTFEISPNVAEKSASFLIRVRDSSLLDYEERQSVEFQILAQELGPATNLSAAVNVTVYLNDVNDNPPIFSQSVYRVELPENMTLDTKVVQVHADDVDTGLGGKVRYTQILGYLNTSLNLDAVTGLITVSTNNHGFDREVMPEYHLYVEARDNDGNGNRVQVPLIIQLIDVNDETPIFEKSDYEFFLASNLRGFTSPAFIKATDLDATAPNNEIRYEIIDGNYENHFDLHKITGELTVRDQVVLRDRQQPQSSKRQKRQTTQMQSEQQQQMSGYNDIFILSARAYDLGVPVRSSITTIRIYPPERRTRTVTFLVPGYNLDKRKTEETLSTLTGGEIIIHNIRTLGPDEAESQNIVGEGKERSVVTATVLYDGNSVVDLSQIQQRLSQRNSSFAVMTRDDSDETIYKAENKLLFWLLILLAVLIALTILILLFCCICSWCPLYNAASKRVINVNNTEDDVHLVHRESAHGRQTKSVQVAEWMGRREAWSAEKSSNSQTKPTRWEFSRRNHGNENVMQHNHVNESEDRRIKSADDHHPRIKMKNHFKNNAAKDSHFHSSKINLINDRDVYVEDADERSERVYKNQQNYRTHGHYNHIDDDSMRRHEIDRGSDAGYENGAGLKRVMDSNGELYIKDGNTEILQLKTRGSSKPQEENIYVNMPLNKVSNLQQPHLIMVDESGKEILMRRFIEEQPDGKQIIREHYQVVPGPTYLQQPMPNEVHTITNMPDQVFTAKSGPTSVVYSQVEPQVKVIHTQPADTVIVAENGRSNEIIVRNEPLGSIKNGVHEAKNVQDAVTSTHEQIATDMETTAVQHTVQMQITDSTQSLTQELENSLKQQNALLRQILLEKEKLEERYNQQELALETQSLPCQSTVAIATQTDCEAATQTTDLDLMNGSEYPEFSRTRRRAKSENDDSMSENDYEYISYSPSNSVDEAYIVKGKRQVKKVKGGRNFGSKKVPRKKVVMVEEIKRKIRTPIKEENEDIQNDQRKRNVLGNTNSNSQRETKTSMLRRLKNEGAGKNTQATKMKTKTPPLNRDILMEISDSLDEGSRGNRKPQIRVKEVQYYSDDDSDVDAEEFYISRNIYSPGSINGESDDDRANNGNRFEIHVSDNGHKIYTTQGSDYYKKSNVNSIPATPAERLSRKDVSGVSKSKKYRRQTSEPSSRASKTPVNKPYPIDKDDRMYQSEADLIVTVERNEREPSVESSTKSVPRYMEWYYSKNKNGMSDINENTKNSDKNSKTKIGNNKKMIGGSEKRIHKTRQTKSDDQGINQSDVKYKPEPFPRSSTKLLKEDVAMNKNLKPKILTDTSHPLLQHSEHRFEHEYDTAKEIPVPPTKLPHYMYPETPPFGKTTKDAKQQQKQSQTKIGELKPNSTKTTVYIDASNQTNGPQSKQLNVSTLEDDHDSGIAMNSLLHSMGRRNPIAEKKSVFTIAYDDVSRVQKIQPGSASP